MLATAAGEAAPAAGDGYGTGRDAASPAACASRASGCASPCTSSTGASGVLSLVRIDRRRRSTTCSRRRNAVARRRRPASWSRGCSTPGSGAAARRPAENLAAHNLYLQGRYHLNQRTDEGLHKALEFFEKAIVEDAQFALAHSGLADAYGLLAHYGVRRRRRSGRRRRRAPRRR